MADVLAPEQSSPATSATETFTYKPLQRDELRLLTVHPPSSADSGGFINCSVEHFSLDDVDPGFKPQETAKYVWGDYIAISYCWGSDSENPSGQVRLNGHLYRVTANLEAALHSIHAYNRKETVPWPVRYWIDALCIDQTNHEEVKREILRMKDVYSKATAVLVHLGLDTDDTDLGCERLQALARDLREGVDVSKDLLIKRFKSTEEDRAEYRAIVKLICRPYWYRIWILQELAMSTGPVTVLCGKHTMAFEDIHPVARLICLNSESVTLLIGPSSYTHPIVCMLVVQWANVERSRRRQAAISRDCSYQELRLPLLMLAQMADSSRAHDKIYGILGLMPEAIRSKMEPYIDYNLPVSSVFSAFSRAVIDTTGDLDIICAKNFNQTMIPTWATDWQMPFDRACLPHDWHFYCYDQFDGAYSDLRQMIDSSQRARADGGRRSGISFSATANQYQLRCSGRMIGTVDGIAPYHGHIFGKKYAREGDHISGKGSPAFMQCVQPTVSNNPYGNDEAKSRALIHTLFGNPVWGDSEEAALFHIPWIANEDFPMLNPDGSLAMGDEALKPVEELSKQGWGGVLGHGFFAFEWFRRLLSQFRIGSQRFQDYFDSKIVQCTFPTQRIRLDMGTMLGASAGRRLITLSTGHFGCAPETVRKGDRIFVLFGCSVPVVLRPEEQSGHLEVVGECYVEGFMNGEAVNGLGENTIQQITLC